MADVDTGDRSEPSITYTLTIWTQSWVVRVSRRTGERWPVVAPIPRTQLEWLELAQAPVVTIDMYGSPEREWRALLRYSVFDIEVNDRRAEWLPVALPSLLQDLKA